MPQRVQLSRAKGWRMPPNTVSVARPTKWGNPSAVVLDEIRPTGDEDGSEHGPWLCMLNVADRPKLAGFWFSTRDEAVSKAVDLYRWRLTESPLQHDRTLAAAIGELRGKDLACWCALGRPCHADVLLELANT